MTLLSFLTPSPFLKARTSADAARDKKDWATALLHYKIATSIQPKSPHLYIQAGNMAKELGDYVQAELLYLQALRLCGVDEIHLQMGHLAKVRGHTADALSHYTKAFEANPMNADAKLECGSFDTNPPDAPS